MGIKNSAERRCFFSLNLLKWTLGYMGEYDIAFSGQRIEKKGKLYAKPYILSAIY